MKISKNNQIGFKVAKEASRRATAPKTSRKIGAALYSGSILLSVGHNTYGYSHPDCPWGIHAEHRALIRRQHNDDKNNLIMYVYREKQNGDCAICRPCYHCMNLMREAGVRLVRFLDEDGKPQEIKL